MRGLIRKLSGGDRRSIGRSDEVVAEVLENPPLFDVLFDGMWSADPVVRMRCADAAEKVTARRPGLLGPRKADLLRLLREEAQQEVRWHAAQMVPRLDLDVGERDFAFRALAGYLDDGSRIVRVCAMQALAELATGDPAMEREAVRLLEGLTASDSPAVGGRARKLLRGLAK